MLIKFSIEINIVLTVKNLKFTTHIRIEATLLLDLRRSFDKFTFHFCTQKVRNLIVSISSHVLREYIQHILSDRTFFYQNGVISY
jgi:hypothetical protein